jgi:hypothetical protein
MIALRAQLHLLFNLVHDWLHYPSHLPLPFLICCAWFFLRAQGSSSRFAPDPSPARPLFLFLAPPYSQSPIFFPSRLGLPPWAGSYSRSEAEERLVATFPGAGCLLSPISCPPLTFQDLFGGRPIFNRRLTRPGLLSLRNCLGQEPGEVA